MTYRISILAIFAASIIANAVHAGNQGLGWPGKTLEGFDCYGRSGGSRAKDYRGTTPESRNSVERRHFTPEVERLIRGESTSDILADLDYTLNKFPNHHRALWSISRYYLQQNQNTAAIANSYQRGPTPPECYFHRARRFAPDDPMVPAIYGIYLHRRGDLDAALQSYLEAEALDPNLSELAYNIGLLYFDLQNYDQAEEYAIKARKLGFPLNGLDRKLQRIGDTPQPQPVTEESMGTASQ